MANYQVTCIRRDGSDADRRIDRLGGQDWNDTIDSVIQFIQSGGHRFWTAADGKSVWVEVRQHPVSGRLFLQTEGDNYPNNNLLKLPECP